MGSTEGHIYTNESLNLAWEFPSDWTIASDAPKQLDVESQTLLRFLPSGPGSPEYFQLGVSDESQYESTIKDHLAEKGWEAVQGQGYYTLGGGIPAHRYNFQSKNTPTQYLSLLAGPRLGHIVVIAITAASTDRTNELIKAALNMKVRPDWPLQAENDAMPPGPPPARVRVSSKVSQSLCLCGGELQPIYPAIAKKAHIQGPVNILAHIDKNGAIKNLYVEDGNPLLIQAALKAVSRWKYKPYLLNGQPTEVETQIVVNFTLQP
jgi:TonB family protein